MRKFGFLFAMLSVFLFVSSAFAAPVNLGTFTAEPNDSNVVSIGSNTITFYESMDYGFIYAANDSFFVDATATALTYNYSLTPGSEDDYDWLVTIVNNSYEMEIEQTGSGAFSIDMTPYRGQTISLAFGLEYDSISDEAFSSTGIISNVELNSVPVPSAIFLLGSGILALIGIGRKNEPSNNR